MAMPSFAFKAVSAEGQITEGAMDAPGRQEALRQLQQRGLQPVRLDEKPSVTLKSSKPAAMSLRFARKKVTRKELENFMRQLSSLLSAGISLSRALQILAREASSPAAAATWKSIHDLVIDGTSLADSMAHIPQTFPRVYVAMVRAGEAGGFLDVVLGQIADFQSREKELREKVQAALIYPAVLLVLAITVLTFLLTFFIPRFQTIFTGFGIKLPMITQVILAASVLVTKYGLLVLVVVGLGIYFIRRFLKSDHGRRKLDEWMLRLPLFGILSARFAMTRFCRMLGTLTKAGVGLIASLRVARESLGNQVLIDALSGSIERVQKGDALAASLSDCSHVFPGSVIEMISIAEETGRLDEELIRLANVTEHEMDGQLRTAVALAEPLLLFLMAALIGTIFIGMILPIFSLEEQMR